MVTAIGLMSGTSMDGIDVALIETDGLKQITFGPAESYSYSAHETQAIEAGLRDAQTIVDRRDRPGGLSDLEAMLTEKHADAVRRFLDTHSLLPEAIDLIGFHGQTVLHRPDHGLTVQLGDGPTLAQQTGIDVVYDMRANDMANGGQGAPLIPVFHRALAAENETVAFANIGGIANVTFAVPGAPPVAFDCGPGNALIDQWMQRQTNHAIDAGGALALSGQPDEATVTRYMEDDFFAKAYPKSLDRGDFDLGLMPEMAAADGAATLSLLTATGIAEAAGLAGVSPARWIVSGGGAHNKAIMAHLGNLLPDADTITASDAEFSIDFMEAQAWAYLAVRSRRGLALTFPETTGCVEPVTGGVLAPAGPGRVG